MPERLFLNVSLGNRLHMEKSLNDSHQGGLRIQKWFSELGLASRRETEIFIKQGRIKINGKTLSTLGTRVDPQQDRIELDNKPIAQQPPPRFTGSLINQTS